MISLSGARGSLTSLRLVGKALITMSCKTDQNVCMVLIRSKVQSDQWLAI